ncbi:hypothetical protein L6452_22799 [Arctium lappa]|uniref:Uncharacterized protein n=1 Tax=Arctium lappa TaxID=4217 RepID=A0ACB9B160_ARCLA|nr:hypothetical protein L6452_22799 [Arctium lappa]
MIALIESVPSSDGIHQIADLRHQLLSSLSVRMALDREEKNPNRQNIQGGGGERGRRQYLHGDGRKSEGFSHLRSNQEIKKEMRHYLHGDGS